MFWEESLLGKIKFRAILEQVGPLITSLEGDDYFGTSEHHSGRKKKRKILISKTAMVGCCKLSLYANDFCD